MKYEIYKIENFKLSKNTCSRIRFIRQIRCIRRDFIHVMKFGRLISSSEVVYYFCIKKGALSVIDYFNFIHFQLKKRNHVI